MNARPLTRELAGCLRILVSMASEIEGVLEPYLGDRHMPTRHHDAAEVRLSCITVRERLQSWLDGYPMPREDECLALLFSDAEQLDRLATVWSRDQGDRQLNDVLECLAEGLRLTSPSLLRWSLGAGNGHAHEKLTGLEKKVHSELASLPQCLDVP